MNDPFLPALTPGSVRAEPLSGTEADYIIEWRCSHAKCSSESKTLVLIVREADSAGKAAELFAHFLGMLWAHELDPDAPVPRLNT